MRTFTGLFLSAVALLGATACASAQNYPSKPIRLVVPFTAGGGTDIAARVVGRRLAERLATTVVIDNRGGAGGTLGTDLVARAAPDGYTLVMVSGSHTINPGLYRELPYDTLRAFAPVTQVVSAPGMLVVHPGLGVRNLHELIELARARRGQLAYASAGRGTPPHLAMELLKSVTGMALVHVPYKGSSAMIPDLLGGQIAATIPSIPSVLPLVKAGRLVAIAVTSRARSAAAPDVPTMIEAGVPDYEASSWYGLLAPAATPRAIVERLHRESVNVLRDDDIRERLVEQGLDPVGNTPQQFAAVIVDEIARWRRVINASGGAIE
jgi:tripartite-type tricarboxylate transporter receptor subunit TctC